VGVASIASAAQDVMARRAAMAQTTVVILILSPRHKYRERRTLDRQGSTRCGVWAPHFGR
jgi:hypothetical protein